MDTKILLLRGVNVGGRHRLPMSAWATGLTELGFRNVRTYIQSGNAVVASAKRSASAVGRLVADDLQKRFGWTAEVWVFSLPEWQRVIADNPFPTFARTPAALHVYFLQQTPADPDLTALQKLAATDERFALRKNCLYLAAPAGIGRSRLAARIERLLGVSATARNWNTLLRLAELAGESD